MSGPDVISTPNPAGIINFKAGTAVSKSDAFTPPDFSAKELNDKGTIDNINTIKLEAAYHRLRLNFGGDYSAHLYGEENPYYPGGLRFRNVNIGACDLGNRFDFKLGRFSKIVGRSFGIVDGLDLKVHSQDHAYSLAAFGGFLPELVTMDFGERFAWGAIASAEIWKTWANLSFYQVLDEAGEAARDRINLSLLNQSLKALQIRSIFEYDPLQSTLTKLLLSADYQASKGWRFGMDASRTDPSFEVGSFFNTFPHYPYWHYALRTDYKSKNFGWDTTIGRTEFEYDSISLGSMNFKLYGAYLGGTVSKASVGSDPYLEYMEAHLGYDKTIKDYLRFGVNGSVFRYDRFDGSLAYQAGTYVRWEIIDNLVLDARFTARQNVDQVFDPLFSVGLNYYFFKAWMEGKE